MEEERYIVREREREREGGRRGGSRNFEREGTRTRGGGGAPKLLYACAKRSLHAQSDARSCADSLPDAPN